MLSIVPISPVRIKQAVLHPIMVCEVLCSVNLNPMRPHNQISPAVAPDVLDSLDFTGCLCCKRFMLLQEQATAQAVAAQGSLQQLSAQLEAHTAKVNSLTQSFELLHKVATEPVSTDVTRHGPTQANGPEPAAVAADQHMHHMAHSESQGLRDQDHVALVLSHVQQLVSRSQRQHTELELLKQHLKSHSAESNTATELMLKALQQTGSPSMLHGVSGEPTRASVQSSHSHSALLGSEPITLSLHPSVSVHQSSSISPYLQSPLNSLHPSVSVPTAQSGYQAQRLTEQGRVAAAGVCGNSNAASSSTSTSAYACQDASQDSQGRAQASLSSVAQAAAEHIKHASDRLQEQDSQMRQLYEQLRASVSRTAESEACQSKLLQQLQDTQQSLQQVGCPSLKPMHCFPS